MYVYCIQSNLYFVASLKSMSQEREKNFYGVKAASQKINKLFYTLGYIECV